MLFSLFSALIVFSEPKIYEKNTHSASGRAPTIPFLLLIPIGSLPSSFGRGRRRSWSGFCRLLPLLRARMFATWRAGSRAWPSKHAQTIGIRRAARAGQEVTKRGRQVRSIFEKFFNLCKNFSLPMKRQSQTSIDGKDEHYLRWIYDWLGSPKTVCMCLDHC